jgi:cyclase
VIARLDIKAPNVVKGINLEGLRVVGSPESLARQYYLAGIDELLYVDIVASLYQRNSILDIISRTAEEVYIPITVGGGIRTLEDATKALRAGADKIAINTAAFSHPKLISEIANRFGTQCVVANIEAKTMASGKWEAFTDNGREHTGRDVLEWVEEVQALGAGEILLTSVDKEGKAKGCDLELCRQVARLAKVPMILSGGVGKPQDVADALTCGADAVAVAHILHYNQYSVAEIKQCLVEGGIECR